MLSSEIMCGRERGVQRYRVLGRPQMRPQMTLSEGMGRGGNGFEECWARNQNRVAEGVDPTDPDYWRGTRDRHDVISVGLALFPQSQHLLLCRRNLPAGKAIMCRYDGAPFESESPTQQNLSRLEEDLLHARSLPTLSARLSAAHHYIQYRTLSYKKSRGTSRRPYSPTPSSGTLHPNRRHPSHRISLEHRIRSQRQIQVYAEVRSRSSSSIARGILTSRTGYCS